jgi:hypothetical protein
MDDRVLANLGPDERKLLATFARYGRDGRAITTASLTAHAGFGLDRKRLSEALRKLAVEGPDHGGRGRSLYRRASGLPPSATAPGERRRRAPERARRPNKRGIDNVAMHRPHGRYG